MRHATIYILLILFLCSCAISEKERLIQEAIEEACAEEGFPNDPVCINETRMIWDSLPE